MFTTRSKKSIALVLLLILIGIAIHPLFGGYHGQVRKGVSLALNFTLAPAQALLPTSLADAAPFTPATLIISNRSTKPSPLLC